MSAGPGGEYRLDAIDPIGALARSVGLARQTMAADLVTRGDGWERGVRSVLLRNDRIALEVVIDRGLDIAGASIRGVPVGWRSPTEIVAPWYVENAGFGPHRGFFGGLLTTCGLDHVGPPTERPAERFNYPSRRADTFPMHGRYSASPARLIGYGVHVRAGALEAYVEGAVTQVSVFGEHLTLTRRIRIAYGGATVVVEDEVVNHGYASSPLAVMYHVNVGWPVTAPGARVVAAGRRLRGDADDAEILPPLAGRRERVWLYALEAGASGVAGIANTSVAANQSAGLRLAWDVAAMPTLVRWEIANIAGHYAVGLEPSTMRLAEGADAPSFPTLEPGQSQTLGLTLELLHGGAGEDLLRRPRGSATSEG